MLFLFFVIKIALQMCSNGLCYEFKSDCWYTLRNEADNLYLTVDDSPIVPYSSNYNLAQVITAEFNNKTVQMWKIIDTKQNESKYWMDSKDYSLNTVTVYDRNLYPVSTLFHYKNLFENIYLIKNLNKKLCLSSSSDNGNRVDYFDCNEELKTQQWSTTEFPTISRECNKICCAAIK